MNKNKIVTLVSSLLIGAAPAWSATGVANVQGTSAASKATGQIAFTDTKEGLKVSGNLSHLPPGDHGFHIHEFGDCGDTGKAAGSHYNPAGAPHGLLSKDGMKKAHAGDLGNLTATADGTATVDAILPGVTLNGAGANVAGRAVIVHEKNDDFGQPVGNAGGRIGCGPIVITGN